MTAEQPTGTVQALNGTVEHITYKNDSNGYTVAVLETADGSVTVVGMMPFLSVGDTLTVTGRFDKHPTYGSQFKVESFEKSDKNYELLDIEIQNKFNQIVVDPITKRDKII